MKKKVFSVLMAFLVIVMFTGFTHPQEIKNSRMRQWNSEGMVHIKNEAVPESAYDLPYNQLNKPILYWNTFLGESISYDYGNKITLDRSGNIYITGKSDASWGNPVNPFAGGCDVFVAKLSPSGGLLWNTFMGGRNDDYSTGITIDSRGNIYVAGGSTAAWGSPLNPFAIGTDAFVAKLNADGVLQWNIFMGGSKSDYISDIAMDRRGNIYVAGGSTATWGSPVNPFAGRSDAFVAKLSSSGSLLWNTFMGGSDNDYSSGIAIDNSGNIYVVGGSITDWGSPVTHFTGWEDAFVARLNSSGVRQWNTFLGWGSLCYGFAIVTDPNGNVFVTGQSDSWGNPVHPFGDWQDAFVVRLNSKGYRLWHTYLGGEGWDWGNDLVIDSNGNIYVTGYSENTWGSPVNPFMGGYGDAFVARLDTNGYLLWHSFLGGSQSDTGRGIATDGRGNVYVTGESGSTWGSPVNSFIGYYDIFVARIIDCTIIPPYEIDVNRGNLYFGNSGNVSSSSQNFVITSNSSNPNVPIWSIGGDQTWLSCIPTTGTGPSLVTVSVNPTGLTAGTFEGTLTVTEPLAVNSPQTIHVTFNVYSPGKTTGPFGYFLTPTEGSLVSGSVPFTGWALDDIGVESVKLYLKDGSTSTYIGDAAFIEGARPDVELAYPGFPMNYSAGWSYMMLTNFLPNSGNGLFTIGAIATDREGNKVTLGTKSITVDNANAVKPFGAIDTPGQGGTASGSSFHTWGWVLTPLPNLVPTDGITINVWVDGVHLGHPTYNLYRPDVATLFPGYGNSNGAGGYFDFNTTAYDNGMHSIFWIAADNAGNTDGIGSRYFYILNTGSSHIASISAPKFKDMLAVPLSHDDPVKLKKGFNDSRLAEEVLPDAGGSVPVRCHELERIELQVSQAGNKVEGYLVVGQRLERLPIGSTLDRGAGTFNWIPGPGFIGTYRLVFVETDNKGEQSRKKISVTIIPKFSRVLN